MIFAHFSRLKQLVDNQNSPKQQPDRAYYVLALRIAGDFGATIAIPALIAAYLGQKLDERWGSEPWMMIACLVVAMAITALMIIKKAKYYAKKYDELNN